MFIIVHRRKQPAPITNTITWRTHLHTACSWGAFAQVQSGADQLFDRKFDHTNSSRTCAIQRCATRRLERLCTHVAPSTPQAAYPHVPVLLDEVLRLLQPVQLHTYADCTLGAGGHAAAVLQAHPVRCQQMQTPRVHAACRK